MDLLEAQTGAQGRTRVAIGFALVLVAVAFGLIVASLSQHQAPERPVARPLGDLGAILTPLTG